MSEIPKAERILRLIRRLRDRKRTVSLLDEWLETNTRTIYRDIEALECVRYLIHRDDKHHYYLKENPTATRAQFSIEKPGSFAKTYRRYQPYMRSKQAQNVSCTSVVS